MGRRDLEDEQLAVLEPLLPQLRGGAAARPALIPPTAVERHLAPAPHQAPVAG
jgi:hypothetical protein